MKNLIGLAALVVALSCAMPVAYAQEKTPAPQPAAPTAILGIPIEGKLLYKADDEVLNETKLLERRVLDVPVCLRTYDAEKQEAPPEGFAAVGGESLEEIFERYTNPEKYVYTVLWAEAFRGPDVVCSVFEYHYTRVDSEVPVPATKKKG